MALTSTKVVRRRMQNTMATTSDDIVEKIYKGTITSTSLDIETGMISVFGVVVSREGSTGTIVQYDIADSTANPGTKKVTITGTSSAAFSCLVIGAPDPALV